jgi:membrane-associated phospholipid phosphatase
MNTHASVERGGGSIRRRLSPVFMIAAKLVLISAFFVLCSIIYGQINEWAFRSPRTRYFPSPREAFPGLIQPWTAIIYVCGGYAAPVLPFFFNWSWPRLRFVLQTYSLSSLIMFASFLAMPVGMRWPAYPGDSLGERLMLAVFAVDLETNCRPSGHAMFAILSAILVTNGGAPPLVRVAVWFLALSICATTITTGQHYYQDVVAGVLTAVLGFFASCALERLKGAPAVPQSPG